MRAVAGGKLWRRARRRAASGSPRMLIRSAASKRGSVGWLLRCRSRAAIVLFMFSFFHRGLDNQHRARRGCLHGGFRISREWRAQATRPLGWCAPARSCGFAAIRTERKDDKKRGFHFSGSGVRHRCTATCRACFPGKEYRRQRDTRWHPEDSAVCQTHRGFAALSPLGGGPPSGGEGYSK